MKIIEKCLLMLLDNNNYWNTKFGESQGKRLNVLILLQ